MSIRRCDCGALVYELRSEEGPVVALDTEDHPLGDWLPGGDGRTASRVTGGGHREHRCDEPIPGQVDIFEAP